MTPLCLGFSAHLYKMIYVIHSREDTQSDFYIHVYIYAYAFVCIHMYLTHLCFLSNSLVS